MKDTTLTDDTVATRPSPPTNKGRRFPITVLSPAEVRALIDNTPARSHSGVRMRALIGVLFGSALRIAEVLALTPADVQGREVLVQHGKGDKARTVGLDATGRDLLDRWMDRRAQLGLNGRHPIFATYSSHSFGKPLVQRDVRKALVRAADRAGITKRVHPHGLRHSLAYDLARTEPMHVVQGQLGHASLATTGRYLAHLGANDLVEAMSRRTW
ncbi:site-specific integrase [Haloechinothrix salitolerans]|uniref:Tyrosine-type recombinase/integrase n=1 Tax=Haloechinothrix salitolerans TaxID=926830 RepID=A0ABW2C8F6_9PSEU